MRTFAQKTEEAQQRLPAKTTTPGRVPSGRNRGVSSILHLQRTVGNQAVQRLLQRTCACGGTCPKCRARQRDREPESLKMKRARSSAHDLSRARVHSDEIQRQPAARPTSENVWGLRITRRMCGCRQRVRDGIAWANTAGATYAACDVPANPTSTEVEACFDAAHPGTTVAGSTSASGTVTLPPPSADPCQRIDNKATYVHETMHARHTNDIARAQGTAFFREWKRLSGDPNRLDTLRASFPAEVAAFETQWHNGHDWAQDEVNSYRRERRFLRAALNALGRIC